MSKTKLPIPDRIILTAWLKEWGQKLGYTGTYEIDGELIPADVCTGMELPAPLSISELNNGLSEAVNAVRSAQDLRNLDEFRENTRIITKLVLALRSYRNNGDGPNFYSYQREIIKDAFQIFSKQASVFLGGSNGRLMVEDAWVSYYAMATRPKNFLSKLFGRTPEIPDLEIDYGLRDDAEWLHGFVKKASICGHIEQGILTVFKILGDAIDLRFTGIKIEKNDEVKLRLKPKHIVSPDTNNKLRAFISGICKTLGVQPLTVIKIRGDAVEFTLGGNLNHLLNLELRTAFTKAEEVLKGLDIPIECDIRNENPAPAPDATNFEKVISAAFIGAGLGKPVRIQGHENAVLVYLPPAPVNSKGMSPLENAKRVHAVTAALKQGAQAWVEADASLSIGMVIKLHMGIEDQRLIENATPKNVLDAAKKIVNAQKRGASPEDESRGWEL